MKTNPNEHNSAIETSSSIHSPESKIMYGPKQSEVLGKDTAKERDKIAFPDSKESETAHSFVIRALSFILFVVVYPLASMFVAFFTEAPLQLDTVSPRTVIAGQQIKVIDEEATALQQREARNNVKDVLVPDNEARSNFIQGVIDTFTSLQDIRESVYGNRDGMIPETVTNPQDALATEAPPDPNALDSSISRGPGIRHAPDINNLSKQEQDLATLLLARVPALGDQGAKMVAAMSNSKFQDVKNASVYIAQQTAQRTITSDTIENYKEVELVNQLAVSGVRFALANTVIGPIIKDNLTPTYTVDEARTSKERLDAAQAVNDVLFTVSKGMPIVRAGDRISPTQIKALEAAGLQGTDPYTEFTNNFSITLLMVFCIGMYLRTFRNKIWNTDRYVLLISTLFAGYGLAVLLVKTFSVTNNLQYFAIPLAAISILGTVLFDSRIGILLIIPCIAITTTLAGQIWFLPWLLFMALVPLTFVGRSDDRFVIRYAVFKTLLLSVSSAPLMYAFFVGLEHIWLVVVFAAINGLATIILVLVLLPIFESAFNIVTQSTLFNLADRNHPLLRELESSALGTYNHSVMVSTLASRAARAIGADALLVEVMALYHDVGKLERPYFFVENQAGMANPHDSMHDPLASADIIHRHVPDGAKMAILHRMPTEIVDGIRTHHGNTVVAYFYRVAVQEAIDKGEPEPDINQYRYQAPRPFTKEQAVLMLSDGCEGATRAASMSTGQISREVIEKIVTGIINDRVRDGQLDNSPLTFNDLRTIETTLISSLEGIYHPRVAYPKAPSEQ